MQTMMTVSKTTWYGMVWYGMIISETIFPANYFAGTNKTKYKYKQVLTSKI